jgi:hypothetical protein
MMPQPPQYPPPPPAYAMAPIPAAPQMQPPPAPQAARPAGKPTIFWVLLLVLGCLFFSAVVLVLIFALKH